MKNLLDNNGVKRLVQNIKDWAESKFIDSDSRVYDPLEIDYLVRKRKIKKGKIYIINYNNDFERISFKDTYKNSPYNGNTTRLYLKGIDTNQFCENAYYFYSNKYLPIKFKYIHYDYVIQYHDDLDSIICKIRSSRATYIFKNFIDNGNEVIFYKYAGRDDAPEQIIISKSDIKHNNVINIDGIPYTVYYNGLGTITWMKDQNNNETNFNNYILKDNNKVVDGSNNIVKCNIDFGTIKGDNNIVEKGCNDIEINGSDNVIKNNCNCIRLKHTSENTIHEQCVNLILENGMKSSVGENCFGLLIEDTCQIGKCNSFNIIKHSDTEDYVVGRDAYYKPDLIEKRSIPFYNNKNYKLSEYMKDIDILAGETKINDYCSIDYYKGDDNNYIFNIILNPNIGYDFIDTGYVEINDLEFYCPAIDDFIYVDGVYNFYMEQNIVVSFILEEKLDSEHPLVINSINLILYFVDSLSINNNNQFIIEIS